MLPPLIINMGVAYPGYLSGMWLGVASRTYTKNIFAQKKLNYMLKIR